ncbi:AbrB/MazE/SpoVT family DNA-binding domain-containing protein [Gemmatimonas sp.]|uniref:AbrB/MazE/SpoVT family DNA-binding domain-containing protein n=1 Tax=Gemmatimonas sp. TaxID=1962908 RepID=UPI0035681B7F
MKARLVRIGNSRGIRLPKPLIEQAGLTDEVELRMQAGVITIRAAPGARAGWAEAAKLMRSRDDDRLLDPPVATRFDEDEWEW